MPFVVNLGGEGEEPNALNQQHAPQWTPARELSRGGDAAHGASTFADLLEAGEDFLLCRNERVALPDACVDRVVTNNVRVYPHDADRPSNDWFGPWVVESEITRILRPGGEWYHSEERVPPGSFG